ncbi:cytochrome P450 76A1-like [Diospyros lotus]|uniref:cytochrome P450 76A1-like n=1 Tax=Diospyros lotus TaxID=55363 RepID=UPI00225AC1AB|nr:cytochrome P450 76A1-like [Diospyros lotus]
MGTGWSIIVWSIIILLPILLLRRGKRAGGRLPPEPPGWPLFGHMFHLGSMPHHTIAGFRDQYGPIVWLRLGSRNAMAILSAKAAGELFKNHDLAFAERTITQLMESHGFHKAALSLAPYGPYWRLLRRICTTEMLVARRINETVAVRQKCVADMLTWIEAEAMNGDAAARGVHVGRFVFLAAFNTLGNLMLSRDLVDPQSEVASEFFQAMIGLMEGHNRPNIADLFPWLRWLDPQGLRKKMDSELEKTLKIASGYVKERLKEREAGAGTSDEKKRKDFLDVLLDYEGNGKDEPAKIPVENLSIFILEIFLAGSETTSSAIEWAMTELLCHPEALMKAQSELHAVVGANGKMEESHIEKLPYLQAIVKETMRLHPPIPLLIPRKAVQDADFLGYRIPKDTQVFVNAWAIGRDSECWEEATVFRPDRFLDSKVDYKGQNYELLPFGAGRRMCAGVPLAHRMLQLVLGSLLHEFDWELEDGVSGESMDRREAMGVTARKLEPLVAVARKKIKGKKKNVV